MNILNARNVYAGYKDEFILKNISLSIHKGSLNGIVGPNGAGKSTLIKVLTGILKPFKGEVILSKESLHKITPLERSKKIGLVSQFIENRDITALNYVLAGRTPYFKRFQLFETQKDYEIAQCYMTTLGVWEHRNKLLSKLSGGEQQLVSIASALVQEPELLFLDEPTAHLDMNHQIAIMNILKDINEKLGVTIVMVLHDLNLASEFCNNLIMLKNGEIFSFGSPEEVITYQNIESIYNMVVVTSKNPLSGKPFVLPAAKERLKSDIKREQS